MKNITVSVDDETYRKARVLAAQQDTSVSAMVRAYLTELAQGESEFDRLARLEAELRGRIGPFRGGDRLRRDEVHERGVGRE